MVCLPQAAGGFSNGFAVPSCAYPACVAVSGVCDDFDGFLSSIQHLVLDAFRIERFSSSARISLRTPMRYVRISL